MPISGIIEPGVYPHPVARSRSINEHTFGYLLPGSLSLLDESPVYLQYAFPLILKLPCQNL